MLFDIFFQKLQLYVDQLFSISNAPKKKRLEVQSNLNHPEFSLLYSKTFTKGTHA